MKVTLPDKCLYHDLAIVKVPADVDEKVNKPFWESIVIKATRMKSSMFYRKKNKIVGDTSICLKVCGLVAGKEIQHWRQDNAGDNKIMEQKQNMSDHHWKFTCKVEYTATRTLQYTSYAKVGVTLIAGMTQLIINQADIQSSIMYKLFGKVCKTAAKLDQLVVKDVSGVIKTGIEH